MYSYVVDPSNPKGYSYIPSGSVCTTDDAAPPVTDGGDGGSDGGGDGGSDGGGDGGSDGGGDGGSDGGSDGGGDGGGGGGGSDGGGDGDGDGDGGTPGDGDGTTPGEGDGDGPGDGIGDLYKGNGKTAASVYADFKGKIGKAPIFKAAEGFFGGCGGGGGTCPNATWDGGEWAGKYDLSQLCTGALGELLGYAGWVFVACMGIVAFRWALL
ncbi:hypothetical protein [Xanthomonas campestris]|uniref:hypothetical protein n=1 Tax=Xanthomonas campestris TaxID=339 RepID=UPI0035562C6F